MDLLILKHLTPMKSYRRWSGRLLSAASRLHGSSAPYCASLLQRSFRVRAAAPQGPPWALTGAPGGQAPSLDSCSASLRRRKKGQHLPYRHCTEGWGQEPPNPRCTQKAGPVTVSVHIQEPTGPRPPGFTPTGRGAGPLCTGQGGGWVPCRWATPGP